MMHTHDGLMHMARTASYLKALESGQIMPRWAGDLNYGYGMPLFNFYYHIPYLIGSVFLALGTTLTLSFKLTLFLGFILSGVFMFLFAKKFFADNTKALLTALLYQFAPFHMVDLTVRGDTGEILAMTFFPLALFAILTGSVPLLGTATALMILSHSAVSLQYFAVLTLFAVLFSKRRIRAFIGLFTGLCISAFYWLPVVFERKYTYGDLFMKDMYKTQFPPFFHFFIPNFTNSASLLTGGINVSFGLVGTGALLLAIALLLRNKLAASEKKTLWFSIFLVAASLFFMTQASAFVWSRVSILRAFQFPWRFLVVSVFALAFLGGATFVGKKSSPWLTAFIIAVTLLNVLVYFRPPLGFDRINEAYYRNYPLDTTYFGETNLVWSAGHESSYPKAPFVLIAGRGVISDITKTEIRHTFTVTAKTSVTVLDNTQYYPGWRVYDGDTKIPIEFQNPDHRGLITFALPPGTHHIAVSFGETPVRAVSDIISVASVITILFLMLLPRKRHTP